MQKPPQKSAKEGFGPQDVIYILYKHKWKIIILSLLGFTAAGLVYKNRKPLYQSESKLLVRYVVNRNSIDTSDTAINAVGITANHVIDTEIEILKSEDVAKKVAETVGVNKLLPDAGDAATPADAAGVILSNLVVLVMPGSNVIHINYSALDPELTVAVSHELMNQYFSRHLEIHRSAQAFDLVSKQAEEVKKRLNQTEKELDSIRSGSGITTLAEATGALATQMAKTKEDMMSAKAELAEQTARMRTLEKTYETANQPPVGGIVDKSLAQQIPTQVVTEYKTLLDTLSILQKRDMELRLKFKPGNRLISLNQQQLDGYESKRRGLVAKYPDLIAEAAIIDNPANGTKLDLLSEKAKLASINAKVEIYDKHLDEIKEQFKDQYAIGSKIEELDRRKQMEDAEYRSLELNLKNAKLDQTLDPSRMPNITVVQQPSKPLKTYDKVTQKIILGLAGAGMALGLGLAFIIELLFNRKIERPMEIQARLQLPLLLSIPYISRKGRGGFMLAHEPTVPKISNNRIPELALAHKEVENDGLSARRANHFILPFAETIRDRIIFNFEINNILHKPKLVAVTGLSEGAGSSTIAAGLAKSFSEINGAKVLLVDLSSVHPEENPIYGEIARHSLSGALQLARSNNFRQSNQNLYYASATARRDDSGLTTFSPMHLYELMPHLQASDYDYIIFDMPPIDQTSRTLTMAGLMDKVLLVLDAENTNRDALKWGYSELGKGRADVSCIFNKTRSHAPGWLVGDS